MNFNEKIQEMDYQVRFQNKDCIELISKQNLSDIIIIFDNKNKKITGYLLPNNILIDLDDISHQYTIFRKLEADLKEFASLSKYGIM